MSHIMHYRYPEYMLSNQADAVRTEQCYRRQINFRAHAQRLGQMSDHRRRQNKDELLGEISRVCTRNSVYPVAIKLV